MTYCSVDKNVKMEQTQTETVAAAAAAAVVTQYPSTAG